MRSTAILAALFAATLLSSQASADTPAEREGRALFVQGNQHATDGDYAGALALFQSAYEKYPNVKILLNIGTMLHQLGRNAEAVEAYDAYLRNPSADARRKEEVSKLLAALDVQLAKLTVVVDDPEATVLVDGVVAEHKGGAVSMRIAPGPHTISVAPKEGQHAAPSVANIVAVAGEESKINLRAPRPEPEAPTEPPSTDTKPPMSNRRLGGFVVGGVGLAGLAVGGITGIVSLLDHSAAESACPTHRDCTRDTIDQAGRGKMLSIASTVAFAAGAAGVGVGVYLVLTGSKSEIGPKIGISARPDGTQMDIHGRF